MKYFTTLIGIILFLACDHRVKFADAMPPDIELAESIPDVFLGTFICESDSSRLYINENSAVKESHYLFETSIQRIRETENCSLVAGGLYLPGRQECIPFKYIDGDSVSATVYELDTIFAFRENEAAKYYKGHLFVNYNNEKGEWDTWMFTPQTNGTILFEFIAVPDNERKIIDVTKDFVKRTDANEKIHYTLNPTKKEFDQILNRDYLFECDILTPVNLELNIN